jgi:hypothetical protein
MLPMAVFADGFDDVIASMRYGNAGVVAKYFNSNVELTLLENEGVYSKQQAEIMLRNFFAQYPAKNIMIQHRGSSAQAAKYAIAIYEANNGKFRVYIFMKDSGAGLMIHELRIERE